MICREAAVGHLRQIASEQDQIADPGPRMKQQGIL
jgi:hypothetical protein